jgi:hypothetical protein
MTAPRAGVREWTALAVLALPALLGVTMLRHVRPIGTAQHAEIETDARTPELATA